MIGRCGVKIPDLFHFCAAQNNDMNKESGASEHHPAKKIIVAIDGYSSCGKSTLAKGMAKNLHYAYLDSGAMYRAVTLFFLRNQVDYNDTTAVEAALPQI